MKQPRFITSKFDGRCADCGRETRAGERVYWRARGEIECGDCAAFNGRENAGAAVQAAPAAQPAAAPSGDFDPALTWDDTPPSAGASIGNRNGVPQRVHVPTVQVQPVPEQCDNGAALKLSGNMKTVRMDNRAECDDCGTLAELSHVDSVGLALCHDCEVKADAAQVPDNVRELSARRIEKAVNGEAPELDTLESMARDTIVTLVNALDRMSDEQCANVYAHLIRYGAESTRQSRAVLFREISLAIRS